MADKKHNEALVNESGAYLLLQDLQVLIFLLGLHCCDWDQFRISS